MRKVDDLQPSEPSKDRRVTPSHQPTIVLVVFENDGRTAFFSVEWFLERVGGVVVANDNNLSDAAGGIVVCGVGCCCAGRYLRDGFAPDVLLRMSEQLNENLRRIFNGHSLYGTAHIPVCCSIHHPLVGKLTTVAMVGGRYNMWAYKYDSRVHEGFMLHTEISHITVNLWLTPDRANLNTSTGGMVIYKSAFDAYGMPAVAMAETYGMPAVAMAEWQRPEMASQRIVSRRHRARASERRPR